MAKKRHLASHYAYNRPSKGYQKNQAKKVLKDAGMPKHDMKKIKRNLIIIFAVWVIALIIDTIIEGLSGFVGMLLLGVIIAFGVLTYVKKLDKDVIRAYKRMGVPKEEYLAELRRLGHKEKRIKLLDKLWDKTKLKEKNHGK